ncbi:MAG: Gfo/Idh/MocA family oxidoreductase [Planctomycetes bacterium]|nr:Gfo/Idh/MocA family oxidoreductase [Planctomycetota bacterium]
MPRTRILPLGFFTTAVLLLSLVTFPSAEAQQVEQLTGKKQPAQSAPKSKKIPIKQIAVLRGFPDWVTSVAFSPDGKHVTAGSYEIVKVIDVKTRRVHATLKIKSGYVKALAYSPDGKLLAVGSYQAVRIWETEKYQPLLELEGHNSDVTGAFFSPDGRLLVTSSDDATIRIWNVEDGKEVRAITDLEYPVQAVAFSPDGEWIAAAIGDPLRITKPGFVKLFHTMTGEERTWVFLNKNGEKESLGLIGHEKAALDVAFSDDGRFLISGGLDKRVHIYDVSTGKALGYFDGHVRPAECVAFMPGGEIVISCSRMARKAHIKIWNRADGDELALIEKQQDRVVDMSLSPDGKILATAGYDQTVMLWDLSLVLKKPTKPAVAASKPVVAQTPPVVAVRQTKTLRAGIIGLDTSHVLAFTKVLNDPQAAADIANCKVVAAYPQGSRDIESSTSRVPKYTQQMKDMGVLIVDSIPDLIEEVDVVFLETNDGRPHLEQILPVLKAGKPVFIDKPIAGSLADAVAIFEAARKYDVPIFSSSSLRYAPGAQEIRNGKIGKVLTAESWSPCSLEKTHPDLFWYGIHGVEMLFTMMGTGCQSVQRTVNTADMDEVVGQWDGSRIGTFQGYRKGGKSGYGGSAIGNKGKADAGKYAGYRPLVVDIVKFFRSGKVPVSEAETLEIYAFMEAADESKRQGGKSVTLEYVMKKARAAAKKRLAELDK